MDTVTFKGCQLNAETFELHDPQSTFTDTKHICFKRQNKHNIKKNAFTQELIQKS